MLTDTPSPLAPVSSVVPVQARFDFRSRWRLFVVLSIILMLCSLKPLYQLVRFSMGSELYSYILLIPFIAAYLIWLRRDTLTDVGGAGSVRPSLFLFAIGIASAGFCLWARKSGQKLETQNYLSLMTFSLLCFVYALS